MKFLEGLFGKKPSAGIESHELPGVAGSTKPLAMPKTKGGQEAMAEALAA